MESCNPSKRLVFDEIRQSWVAATAEEIVRQTLLHRMVHHLGYPKELIVVEKELQQLPHLAKVSNAFPDRRVDVVCFAKDSHVLYPLLLIECKDTRLDQRSLSQLLEYNYYVKACFIAEVSSKEIRFGYGKKDKKSSVLASFLPSYLQLLTLVSHERKS